MLLCCSRFEPVIGGGSYGHLASRVGSGRHGAGSLGDGSAWRYAPSAPVAFP